MEGNGSSLVDEPRVHRGTVETGLELSYGERTWRPEQSVIDIIQNPLDAHTSVFERRLLRSVGITEYQPEDEQQQRVIAGLIDLKYAEPEELSAVYIGLQQQVEGIPSAHALRESLEGISFELPTVDVKVADGEKTQMVPYDQLKGLPDTWQIVGFRVSDMGSGFAAELLGVMGATTKRNSSSKRGGLGEGLKMSVTHLTRGGADVRLFSRNRDELWIARPQVKDGEVSFATIHRREPEETQTGSLVDVDFSKDKMDPALREILSQAIDPRKGEGLAKLALEYRGDDFVPLAGKTTEVSSKDVPGGRIYVRGLLVEEPATPPLLFSYNLSEKWAIKGRDRKEVKREVLAEDAKRILSTLDKPEQIAQIVSATVGSEAFFECGLLTKELAIDTDTQRYWKDAVKEAFDIPGKVVFAPATVTTDRVRFASEQGYTVVRLPQTENIEFFQKLYPGEKVSIDQLQGKNIERLDVPDLPDVPDSFKESAPKKFGSIVVDALNDVKIDFSLLLLNSLGDVSPDMHSRIMDLVFTLDKSFSVDKSFRYSSSGEMYVKGNEFTLPLDLGTRVDLCNELIKAGCGKGMFDTQTQAVLTRLAGTAIQGVRPEIVDSLQLSGNYETVNRSSTHYNAEQKESDREEMEMNHFLAKIYSPDVTKDAVEEALRQMRELQPEASLAGEQIFFFEGKVFFVTPERTLQPIKYEAEKRIAKDEALRRFFSGAKTVDPPSLEEGEATQADASVPYFSGSEWSRYERKGSHKGEVVDLPKKILSPDKDTYTLEPGISYLPYHLQDGEALTIGESENGDTILIQRKGNKIVATKSEDGSSLPLGEKHLTRNFNSILISGNVIMIDAYFGSTTLSVAKIGKNQKAVEPEKNEGEQIIVSQTTTDYGQAVWEDPKQVLLDAMQNHIDAQDGRVPDASYAVVKADRQIAWVTKEELLGTDWEIIGIDIQDDGAGFTTPYLTGLGKSTKGDADRGKFGEGLKMLSASAVLQGIPMEISSRNWKAHPTSVQSSVMDYDTKQEKTFDLLAYDMTWSESAQQGSSTKFSLIPLDAQTERLTGEQEAILQAAREKNGNVWEAWLDVLDPRNENANGERGLDRFVLPVDEERPTDGIVSIVSDKPSSVYEKGLLVTTESDQPMLFGYNIDATIINTRERNSYERDEFNKYVREYFSNLTDPVIMRNILETIRDNPDTDYYELQFLNTAVDANKAIWRRTYYDVFGDDAILSLASEERKRKSRGSRDIGGRMFNTRNIGRVDEDKKLRRAVANESHLENDNLVRLPADVTILLKNVDVYTSETFLDDINENELILPEEDKAHLFNFLQQANQLILTTLESLDSYDEGRALLEKVASREELEERKAKLQELTSDHIHVKTSDFPMLGSVKTDKDNFPSVDLNEKIFGSPTELLEVYVHEVSHYLSDQDDYKLGFQRFLMALVLAQQKDKDTKSALA